MPASPCSSVSLVLVAYLSCVHRLANLRPCVLIRELDAVVSDPRVPGGPAHLPVARGATTSFESARQCQRCGRLFYTSNNGRNGPRC